MESRNVTRILGDIRYLGDCEGLTARHPDADILRRVNASIRSLRAFVTTRGLPYFLTSTTAATLAGTQVTGETYSEIPFPATAVQIHGVDVASGTATGDWRPLAPISWAQRRNAGGIYPALYGSPCEFAVRAIPQGDGTTGTTPGTIVLFPAASSGQYKVWFLSDWVDLVNPTDVFLGLPDWHDWVVWDVVLALAARDDDQHETAGLAMAKKAELERRIVETAQRVVSAGPLRPRRARGRGLYRSR